MWTLMLPYSSSRAQVAVSFCGGSRMAPGWLPIEDKVSQPWAKAKLTDRGDCGRRLSRVGKADIDWLAFLNSEKVSCLIIFRFGHNHGKPRLGVKLHESQLCPEGFSCWLLSCQLFLSLDHLALTSLRPDPVYAGILAFCNWQPQPGGMRETVSEHCLRSAWRCWTKGRLLVPSAHQA